VFLDFFIPAHIATASSAIMNKSAIMPSLKPLSNANIAKGAAKSKGAMQKNLGYSRRHTKKIFIKSETARNGNTINNQTSPSRPHVSYPKGDHSNLDQK